MTTQREYTRPPVLDRIITIDGRKVWAARRDFTGRDVLDGSDFVTTISKSLSRYIIRAGSAFIEIGDTFTDENGIDRTVQGITTIGRERFTEIVAETSALNPQGGAPISSALYRFADGLAEGQDPLSAGQWSLDTRGSFLTGDTSVLLASTDSDGETVETPEVGDTFTLTWDSYSITVDLTDVRPWFGGFGGQQSGPRWGFNRPDDFQVAQATGELQIIGG